MNIIKKIKQKRKEKKRIKELQEKINYSIANNTLEYKIAWQYMQERQTYIYYPNTNCAVEYSRNGFQSYCVK